MTFKEIDTLNIDGNKAKLKVRKVVADLKAFAEKTPISVNVRLKKEKLNNDLTAFLNKNTKIRESGVLLAESERIRELIDSVDNNDKVALGNATDAFSLFKSEVSATGYASKSTTDKIKGMLSHVTKIGSFFGLASLAVNNFRKSLSTLKSNDTILTEISKASEMTKKQLEELSDKAFKVASKYGQLSSNYLLGVQEMSRAGYKNADSMAELSTKVQSAGDMTAELANQYIIATDKAYKLNGSIGALTATLDGANNITNNNAVNMTELAEGMSIVGSQAASAGMEVSETTAALSTMIAVTQQGGSQIANAFKGILMNLQQVTGEVEDGGNAIDAESLTKYEKACSELGVSLSTVKDGIVSLKDPMQIIKELSEAYTKLDESDARRSNLLSSVGGKYRANALNAILENYDLYEKMLQEYADGLSSMDKEAEKTANSWEGRMNALQNSIDNFFSTLTNKDAIMGGISFFDRLIQGAEELTNAIGEIPVVLTALNSALVATNKDYGITQIWNKDKGKIDIQGNLLGIDFTAIKNMKKHFAEAKEAIAKWNSVLDIGKADINDFSEAVVQNNAQFKKYLSTCSKDAPASLEGYKSHLKAAGVNTDALRLKTILLNSAITMLGGFVVQIALEWAAKGIDNVAHSAEHCKERVDELMSNYQSAIAKANSNAKNVEELASRYEELSKGVNNLGERVSLTTDEYTEYNKIVNQIADMFPTLIQGYTNEGNAILSLKGNVEGLRDAYKEAQQEAYNMLVASGKDSDGNDIIANYQNQVNGENIPWFLRKNVFVDSRKDGAKESIEIIKKLTDTSSLMEFLDVYNQLFEEYSNVWSNKDIGTLSNTLQSLGIEDVFALTKKDFENIKRSAQTAIRTYQAEIDSALQNVKLLANAYLVTNEDYENLGEYKNATSVIVNSLNSDIADGFKNPIAVGEYVDKIVNAIKDNPDVQDAVTGLFSIDTSNMTVNKAKERVDAYIKTIADKIGENTVDLKVRLGFDNVDDTQKRLQNAVRALADDHGGEIREIVSSDEYAELLEIVNKLTLVEAKLCLKAISDAESVTDAINGIKEALAAIDSEDDDKFSLSISDTIDQLNTKLKPTFDSLKSAWQDIFTDDGFDKEAVDIPMLNSIKSSIKDINELGMNIDLNAFEEFATTITDVDTTEEQAKQAFNDFATSIFYATGATNGMTAETRELVEQLLESLGIVNASEVAEYSLAAAERELLETKAQSIVAAYDLVNASNEEYVALLEEAGAAGVAKQQIYNMAAAEIAYGSNNLSVEQKVQKLKTLATAYGDTTTAALAAVATEKLIKGQHVDADEMIDDLMDQINSTMNEIEIKTPKIDFSGLEKKASKAGSKAGNAYMDALKDKLSNFGNVIKYISDNIGDQIGLFEDQKNAAVEALEAQQKAAKEALEAEKALVQEQIDAKQAEIDKIEEAAKARKNEINLQQKQYELARLQNQKTILQYSEDKGMHYVTDTKGIRDAQEAVTEAKENIQIANLQKEISGMDDTIGNLDKKIEESNDYYAKLIEQAKNYWDALIKGLEDYKSRWTELANIEEQAKIEVALRNLGITADDILNMSESTFDSFKSNYLGVLQEMYAGNDEMISMLQELGGISPEAIQPLSDSLDNVGNTASYTKDRISEITDALDNLDGMESECTVKVNIETVGSIPEFASKIAQRGSINPISDKSQNRGTAHYEGTAKVTGDWSVQSDEKKALVGEEGYEIIVRDGRFFTVGDNGPEMYPIKKGDIVFNHEQSEELLKNGHTSGRGKAYADGTVGGGKFLTPSGMILAPYDPSKDDSYFAKLYTAWNTRYGNVEKNVEDINRTLSQHLVIEHNRQMYEEVNRFVNNSSSVANNKNVQPVVNQNITLNCPNVTNNSGVEYIQKELGHLSLKALQEPLRNY